MRRIIAGLAAVVLLVNLAAALEEMVDRNNLSIKAGPTEPGEALSLVWVEALVYPNAVKADRTISLGVRTASPVKGVKAQFDFSKKPIELASNDNLAWSAAYKLPDNVAPGIHVARYQISGQRGRIQRTIEFLVEKLGNEQQAAAIVQGEISADHGWPLTVTSTCAAYADGAKRVLQPGQTLTSIAKMPWHKVVFVDGKEGWVSSVNVKEPTDDLCQLGEEAARAGNHNDAIAYFKYVITIDPQFGKGYAGLAGSYAAIGQKGQAAEAVKKALRLNERDIASRILANDLAEEYFGAGKQAQREKRWHEAIVAFRQAVELRPQMAEAWCKLGDSLARLGFNEDARDAWRSGLKQDPANSSLQARLGGEAVILAATDTRSSRPAVADKSPAVASMVADDSLKILKAGRTSKGTRIESAIKSVVVMTKSLGTPIVEKGWQVRRRGEKFLVSFLCVQSGGALDSFDWLVDVDTRQVQPHNDNARLLMSRW
jgi:tetratricopeptide (TPR) repeat protein